MSFSKSPSASSQVSATASGDNGSPASVAMTPRTKVRSMLLDLDNEEPDSVSPLKDYGFSQNSPSKAKSSPRRVDEQASSSSLSDDDDDAIPPAPRGRMAARMLANASRPTEETNIADNTGDMGTDNTAYKRVREQLVAEKHCPKNANTPILQENGDSSSETGPSRPMRRRSLTNKKQKATTTTDSNDATSAGQGSNTATDQDGSSQGPGIRKRFLTKKKPPATSTASTPSSSRHSPPEIYTPAHHKSASKSVSNMDSERGKGSDSEKGPTRKVSAAFVALVEKKRKERQAREEKEKREKAEKLAKRKALQRSLMESDDEESDDQKNTGSKLTQQSRPTRKASKKALEEMHRETQRLSRNMQLAHQARTKKKITKESFLARFNLAGDKAPTDTPNGGNISATTNSVHGSDAEGGRERNTPPTSPLLGDDAEKSIEHPSNPEMHEDAVGEAGQLPTLNDLLAHADVSLDKGKGKAQDTVNDVSVSVEGAPKPKKSIRVKFPLSETHHPGGSDDELEILGSHSMKKTRAMILLDRVPMRRTQEDRAILVQRSLAHLTSPSKHSARNKPSITSAGLQALLRQKARQQAARERAEKIQELKDRGIVVLTAEEREKDRQELEDLVEKARRDAAEIGKREKEAAERLKEGSLDDSDDDEEYAGSDEDEEDISGSDEDDAEDDDLDVDNREPLEGIVDEEAEHDSESEKEPADDEDDYVDGDTQEEDNDVAPALRNRKSRFARVLSDDDEEGEEAGEVEKPSSLVHPMLPGTPRALGLTQAFAATMADSQPEAKSQTQGQDSLALLDQMPEPNFPSLKVLEADSQEIVRDSQAQQSSESAGIALDFTQSPARTSVPESPYVGGATQQSMPDPTQDVGFVMSPLMVRGGPPSTVETVLLRKEDTPIKKKGRLVRRAEVQHQNTTQDGSLSQDEGSGFEIDPSAFDIMKKGAKKAAKVEAFDKSRSNAKEMVEEIAEESEDEYAGLGGASDESAGEEDEHDRAMINDEGKEKLEEQKLAALYADKERVSDEAAVSKLYKDLTTGALRRRRGGGSDLDLSDSDEDREAQRRAKRREFQRMRQALFADERVGKIAEDKKKASFLRSIEDRDNDDLLDLDFSDPEANGNSHSQSQSQQTSGENAQDTIEAPAIINNSSLKKRKRPLEATNAGNRLPPNLRRPADPGSKKPSTLAEIRQTVSFLVEEPDSFPSGLNDMRSASDGENGSGQDDDDECIPNTYDENMEANRERERSDDELDILAKADSESAIKPSYNNNPRRTQANSSSTKTRANVIDRLSLLRSRNSSLSSSSSSSSATTTSRLAFHNPATTGPNTAGFRVPTLLRRATTNSSLNSNGSSTSTTNASGGYGTERAASDDPKTKTTATISGASKKASVNFYQESRLRQRERELKGRVEKKTSAVKKKYGGIGKGLMGGLLEGKGSWD